VKQYLVIDAFIPAGEDVSRCHDLFPRDARDGRRLLGRDPARSFAQVDEQSFGREAAQPVRDELRSGTSSTRLTSSRAASSMSATSAGVRFIRYWKTV
jgi:hypothetical protein